MHDQYITKLVVDNYKEQYENDERFHGYVDDLIKGASAEKFLSIISCLCKEVRE